LGEDAMTYEEFAENFSYCPETGIITRLKAPCNSVKVGGEAGYVSKTGKLKYRKIEFKGVCYASHRLAFLAVTKAMPELEVDHIDGNGLNNKFSNLRLVSHELNMKNKSLYKTNNTGQPGVSYFKQTGKWRAAISIGKIKKHIGYYDSIDDAISARKDYEQFHSYHQNHGRSAEV
jgi:hypothetical protein